MAAKKTANVGQTQKGQTQLLAANQTAPARPVARQLSHGTAPPSALMGSLHASTVGSGSTLRVNDPNQYPFSAIVALHCFASSGALFGGTGFLVGPRLILTAAHNLYKRANGAMTAVRIFPGLNGAVTPQTPNILVANDPSRLPLRVYPGWTDNVQDDDNENFDLGAIFLPSDLDSRGIISPLELDDAKLNGLSVNAAGYPALNGQLMNMWLEYGQIDQATGWRIYYDIPTQEGLSGAPVILYHPNEEEARQYSAVGVHTWGGTSSWNFGTRINVEMGNQIEAWLEESVRTS